MARIAIHGFGRIGRSLLRTGLKNNLFAPVAISDVKDIPTLAAHERQGDRLLVLPWDPATWHRARDLFAWIRDHNRPVQRTGVGVKLVPVELPKGAFWLNRVDAIIRQTKGRVLPCHQFTNQAEQRTALDRHWLHRNLRCARAQKPEDFFGHLH